MVDVECETDRRNGVTFVWALVRNTRTTTQTVRLESRLDGPTWPPRRGSVTAPEWTGDAWEGTVEPGRWCGVGFASPAEPTDPPVEVVSVSRASTDRGPEDTEEVLATLEDWSPPSDVLSREP